MNTPTWPDEHTVDKIAFTLLGYSEAERHEIIVDAFNRAVAKNPNVIDPDLDPRIVAFVAAVYRRIAEMERDEGKA
jgi:hypothetical protein